MSYAAVQDLPLSVDDIELKAEICRRSFYQFVKRFWDVIIAEDPVWNWHIEFMCSELQTVAERVFRGEPRLYDLIINVPPGSTKSTICSVMFPAWCWTRMRSARFINGSYSHPLALDLARKSRVVIKSERYALWFPELVLRDDQDTKTFYETTEGGDRHAVGCAGDITGFHGHFLIIDDPINPEDVHSVASLRKVNRWMTETLPSRKVNKTVSVMILIMQRLHEEDPTGKLVALNKANPDKVPVRHICLPAEESDLVSPKRLRLKYVDDGKGNSLLDPIRMPKHILEETKAKLGPFGYSGQFEQWPVPPEGGMFKVSLIKLVVPRPLLQYHRIVRYWDKAGTEGGMGAQTSGTLMAEYVEMIGAKYKVREFTILDVIYGRWDSGERERIIRQTAESDGRHVLVCVEQEPGSGGKESAQDTVRSLAGFTVGKDRVTGNKVLRADPFSVQVNQGNVRAKVGASWWNDYRDQLMLFPMGKLKDMVDSSSGAFAVLTNRVQVGALPRR